MSMGYNHLPFLESLSPGGGEYENMIEYEIEIMILYGADWDSPCASSQTPGSCPRSLDSLRAPKYSQPRPHIL